jgi:hypothetical protein
MPSTYTNILRLELQADGENDGTWGQILNDNVIALIDDAIGGTASISTTGGTTTLSTNDGSADQARNKVLDVTGSLGSDALIEVPAVSKTYLVRNGTSGSFTVEVLVNGQSAGAGVEVPQGDTQLLYCDGSNVEAGAPSRDRSVGTPGSTTDNALVRWDGTGGGNIQNSAWLLEDDDELNAQDNPAYDSPARFNDLGSGSGTISVDPRAYSAFKHEPTGSTTYDIETPSANGRSVIYLEIVGGGDHSISFQVDGGNGTAVFADGSAPSLSTGSTKDVLGILQVDTNKVVIAKTAFKAYS